MTAKKSRGEKPGITRQEHLELEGMVKGETSRSREVKEEKLFRSQAALEGAEQRLPLSHGVPGAAQVPRENVGVK